MPIQKMGRLPILWILYMNKNKTEIIYQHAFISVGVIQYNINTTKTYVCIAINDIY